MWLSRDCQGLPVVAVTPLCVPGQGTRQLGPLAPAPPPRPGPGPFLGAAGVGHTTQRCPASSGGQADHGDYGVPVVEAEGCGDVAFRFFNLGTSVFPLSPLNPGASGGASL